MARRASARGRIAEKRDPEKVLVMHTFIIIVLYIFYTCTMFTGYERGRERLYSRYDAKALTYGHKRCDVDDDPINPEVLIKRDWRGEVVSRKRTFPGRKKAALREVLGALRSRAHVLIGFTLLILPW